MDKQNRVSPHASRTSQAPCSQMSRRSFIGLGSLAAAGSLLALGGCNNPQGGVSSASESAAASGAVVNANSNLSEHAAWLGEAPKINESDVVATKDTDILIVGAGNGGMIAAATAADLGANFIICEKRDKIQDTRHWIGAINTKYTKAAGVEVDTGRLMNEFARYASYRCDMSVLKTWVDESAELIDFIDPILTAAGMKCEFDTNLTQETGGTAYYIVPLEHYYGRDPERNAVLEQFIKDKGHEVTFKHELISLIREDDNTGRVSGAYFKTDEGIVRINAAKGVILTTGGYAHNPEMIKALAPSITKCVTADSYSTRCTGEGIKIAMRVGAQRDLDAAPLIFDRGAVPPGVDAGYVEKNGELRFPGTIRQFNLGSQPFMKVDRTGRRFVNESVPYDFCCYAASMRPGGVFCQVFDDNVREDVKRFNTMGCSRGTQKILASSDAPIAEVYKKQIEEGVFFVADTLDELADKLGFEGEAKQTFLAQVERYNELAASGVDSDFGKEGYRLSTISKAPFYGCWYGGSLLTTLDGLRINKDMQVLDNNEAVIEGLFAAGDCSGSLYGGNYPEYIVGCACGRTATFARHAVRFLEGDLPKNA